jgi:hypothetical protein
MRIENIEKLIFLQKSKEVNSKFFIDMAHEIEYSILLEKKFPNEIFNMYMRIFLDKELLVKSGIYSFMFHLYNDFNKLSFFQKRNLKIVLINISMYLLDDELKFVILDLFLRKFRYKDMQEMMAIIKEKGLDINDNDIVYAVSEMIESYDSGLMKDTNIG